MIQLKHGLQPSTLTKNRKSLSRRRKSTRTKSRALRFERVFSDPEVKPFDQIEWERRTAEITDDGGKVIFKQENVEVPEVLVGRWRPRSSSRNISTATRQGTDPTRAGAKPPCASSSTASAARSPTGASRTAISAKAKTAEIFYDELTWLCVNQYGAFNSPVWFNVGLYHQYGVGKDSGKGNWFYNRKTGAGRARRDAIRISAVQRLLHPVASRTTWRTSCTWPSARRCSSSSAPAPAPIFRRIRSQQEKLSGGGRPSGPLSFLKVYDQVANVVKSGGKTRRAAKMNTLRDWHGDIEEFIDAKQKEEKKAWALIEQGYDGSYNGDAYGSVMYQNENLSVRVSDEFMQAAHRGQGMVDALASPTASRCEKKDARDAAAQDRRRHVDLRRSRDAVRRRDPEMAHLQGHRADLHSTNPCSEYVFLNNTACNLASLNLMKFKREDGAFDVERFKAAVRIFITAQEILVDNASYPTKEIAENSHIFRTLGLGYANLGSLIMSYGLRYDSDEGRALAGAITAIMTGHAYEQSARNRRGHGAVPGLRDARCAHVPKPLAKDNVESMLGVIKQHRARGRGDSAAARNSIISRTKPRKCWDARARARPSSSATATPRSPCSRPPAPSRFLMDCDTTGIEPDIALVKYKLLAGGGMLKIVNRTVPERCDRLGYSAEEIERIIAHIEKYDTIEDVDGRDGADRLAAA